MRERQGFTLIELSIVLVIIGLVVGGILAGRELIEAASIRAQISQIDQMRTAVLMFQEKYGGYPGDLTPDIAGRLGMATRSGLDGMGNGDMQIGAGGFPFTSMYCLRGESSLFWNDLTFDPLIKGRYAENGEAPITIAPGEAGRYLPEAAMGNGASIQVYSHYLPFSVSSACAEHDFCFSTTRITFTNPDGAYAGFEDAFLPAQAFAIDSKMDDGVPQDGRVVGGRALGAHLSYATAPCVANGGSGVQYDLAEDSRVCSLNFAP